MKTAKNQDIAYMTLATLLESAQYPKNTQIIQFTQLYQKLTFDTVKQPNILAQILFPLLLLALLSCAKKEITQLEETKSILEIQDITTEDAEKLLSHENAPKVIDIRTPEEFSAGHLPGAIMIDFKSPSFKAELAKLDQSKEYIFYCRSGGRSTQSINIWEELGFGKVYHLNKGYLSWTESGNPTE